jgi:histidinol dehydrogenase
MIKTYIHPDRKKWSDLANRPIINNDHLNKTVTSVLNQVKKNGDKAVLKYTSIYDGIELKKIEVSLEEIENACNLVRQDLKDSIQTAYKNIHAFHLAQQEKENVIETTPGVRCWRKSVAIEKVGLYIPGGSAPLFSTILMLGIPALIAGCKKIILCTPPSINGEINHAILYTAKLVGITKIYKIGGAQAIAAMAYGTKTITKVNKIFGPGNQYVTKAKELVQLNDVAIDMPAGPSEVLIIADESCNPVFVAADLLSQAEHGGDSQVILLSNSQKIVEKCMLEIKKQVKDLPRKKIALRAIENSKAIILENIEECMEFSNLYAPEHLIIVTKEANKLAQRIINAGSVFIGNYSCESAGDYASGTNHTLPTNRYAKSYSGVSLDSFVKKITFQELSKKGLSNIGKAIEIMAQEEQLFAHKNAVTVRLKNADND